ncbi:MAG TPA: phospholipase D-like domain-containing protein [Methylomirabilota bacterium]|nr:phospholipase D-like domain-containing protein [Methylomirabilota bacterium]
MLDHEVKEALRASLADGQLDRAERDTFRKWLAESAAVGQKRAVYQSIAFDLAREAIERSAVNHHSVLNWLERVVMLLTPLAQAPAVVDTADARFSPQHDCAGHIIQLFDNVRVAVDICVFTITDNRISEAIARAHRRGVNLRIITDDDKVFDEGSDIQRLSAAGVPVRVDITEYHMHHKFAIFDGAMLLNGSYNWTRSAALYNEENYILTGDARLIRPFAELFQQLWEKFGAK